MAKQKVNKFLVAFGIIVFLALGAIAGAFVKVLAFPDENYEVPATQNVTQQSQQSHVGSGEIDANVIKTKELSIHFLELGNKYTGDCTFIKVGNTEILIDAGSRASSVNTIYDYVSPYIEDGVLDYVIVTHAHQDHYAGFATGKNVDSLFDKIVCSNVITFAKTNNASSTMYSNFVRELSETEQKNSTKVYTALQCYNNLNGASSTIDLGNDVTLEILYQKYYEQSASSENDYSVCCMLNQNNSKYYLFTGDLESDGEESLVNSYKLKNGKNMPQVEVYKAGHHGSKTSSSEKLLSVIQPKCVCVCCCAGSSEYTSKEENQFPTQQFIDRIAKYTKNVYVTTLCVNYTEGKFESFNGNIVISCNKTENITVACSNSHVVLKDSDWFKNNRSTPLAWAS